MEVNPLMGGRVRTPAHVRSVQDDPPTGAAAVGNARRTLRAGFTTVRNLGLLSRPAAICSTSRSARPSTPVGSTVRASCLPATRSPRPADTSTRRCSPRSPGVMDLTVEEGIANGIDEIRKGGALPIKHGAEVIKVCCSGGVMSLTGEAGAQHIRRGAAAIVDEASPRAAGGRPHAWRQRREARGRAGSTASSTAS